MSIDHLLLEALASPIKNAIVGGPFGSNLVSKDYVTDGVPVIRGQNMSGRWVSGDFVFVSEDKAHSLAQNLARPGDLVFTQRGTLGQVAIVPRKPYDAYVVSQSQMKITVNPQKADVVFLYYLFKSPSQQRYIQDSAIQAGVPHTNLGILKRTPVCLPTLPIQRKIAALLGSLDDRIDLLRDTNATLEAIAQAFFRSWFVDFDPVRAKQEGRASEGMDVETAALFPDEFAESEFGLLPRGWRNVPLDEAYDINPVRKLKKGEVAPYLDMANAPTQGHSADVTVQREMASGTKFIGGDTLLARITPCLENGKTAFVDFLKQGQVGWGSTEFIVMRPKPPLPLYHAYLLCRQSQFREFAVQSMAGTSGRQRVQNDVLGRYRVALPTQAVAEAFANIVEPIQEKITMNARHAQTLAEIRDTLLPRLITGRLRLPEAEEQVREVFTGD